MWLLAALGLGLAIAGLGAPIVDLPHALGLAFFWGGIALCVVAVGAALLRAPLGRYRERVHVERLGQDCIDAGKVMLDLVPGMNLRSAAAESQPEEVWKDLAVHLEGLTPDQEERIVARYTRQASPQVFAVARELERRGVIDHTERDQLSADPASLRDLLQTALDLLSWGVRLGGKVERSFNP